MRGSTFPRDVTAERLDWLAPDDPLARRSRQDLQRVHLAMRSVAILERALTKLSDVQPQHILELGAGDGSLMLRLLRARGRAWPGGQVTFLDRQDLVSAATRHSLATLGWQVDVVVADVLEWVRLAPQRPFELCLTSLFLHHFRSADLAAILAAVAQRSRAFIALEPRRNRVAWLASHCLGLLGANEVTREDGVSSVIAGFAGTELTCLWPEAPAWRLQEYFAWPFTHCFLAEPEARGRRHALSVSC